MLRGITLAFAFLNLSLAFPVAAAEWKDPKLVIFKGARRLEVHSGKTLLKTYPIALGFEPIGTKLKQGDGKTPEGDYLLVVKNPNSAFTLSMGLSYPGPDDAARGLKEGLITAKEKKRIDQAAAAKQLPPQNTSLGGEIFIHGGGIGWDWTRGCIALTNDAIRELYASLPEGTPVRILP